MTGVHAPTLMDITGADAAAPALADQRRILTWGELEDRAPTRWGPASSTTSASSPGSTFAVIARNRHEFVEAMLGAMRAGMTTIPVKASWTGEEVGYLLDDSGAALVITDLDAGRAAASERGLPVLDLGPIDAPDAFEGWLARQSSRPLPHDRNGRAWPTRREPPGARRASCARPTVTAPGARPSPRAPG